MLHDWPQLPAPFQWQTTHNVAVDRAGQLYVIHEGHADKPDHPSIFVFDAQGKYVRSFGSQFQGGGHGIEVHEEDGKEFLYICAYQQVKAIAKLDLLGEVVWTQHAPMKSGVYAEGEDTNPQKIWGRDRFMPTNIAFLPNGEFMVADGYGSFYRASIRQERPVAQLPRRAGRRRGQIRHAPRTVDRHRAGRRTAARGRRSSSPYAAVPARWRAST